MNMPEVKTLPALDRDRAEAEAEEMVHATLDAIADPMERMLAAAEYIRDLEQRWEKVLAHRDAAAYTLSATHVVRRGAAIHAALGVGRTRWQSIRQQQAALAADPVPQARLKLIKTAHEAAKLRHAITVANTVRDAAINDLPADLGNTHIARLIGCDPSRVSHIRGRGRVLLTA